MLGHVFAAAMARRQSRLRGSSKREANGPNPAVIVGMELCRSDLDTAADSEAQSLGNLKHAKNDTRRQECLLLAGIRAIGKESRILLDHWPNSALDTILKGRVP